MNTLMHFNHTGSTSHSRETENLNDSDIPENKQQLQELGFTIVNGVFAQHEVHNITAAIQSADPAHQAFGNSGDVFAIRRLLRKIPALKQMIFTEKLVSVIHKLFGDRCFVVKSIYFNKPEKSNWFVAWHQDLTISVDKKINEPDYGPWTEKQQQFAVQPPIEILRRIFTVRIHLDDTDGGNGALKVIPRTHLKGIIRPGLAEWEKEDETTCSVSSGGIMVMRPLLLHSSGRTVNNRERRVIHLEFSDVTLAPGLQWAEKDTL